MIEPLYKPVPYTVTPARGQALLSFQGRRMPDHMPLFEVVKIEEVRIAAKRKPADKPQPATGPNLLLHGDCLSACSYLKSKNIKVDLFYIDPPFASGANYAKKIFLRNGGESALESDDNAIGEEIMYGDIWQKEDYLNWLYERLLGIRDVMAETGSIFVHLDWHIGHYVKILLDEVFGEENFRNEIIWYYYNKMPDTRKGAFPRSTDTIYWYVKNTEADYYFNPLTEKRAVPVKQLVRKKVDGKMVNARDEEGNVLYQSREDRVVDNVWRISMLQPADTTQNVGYVTQKPDELLERIINACSTEGMTVADFFCGSGTAAKVAFDLGRRFIGCDVGINAIQTTRDGLLKAGASFDILKIQDGVRLFRNPAQTAAKIFSLVEGFKKREELELGDFWDGGIPGQSGRYVPVKFVGLQERLTPALLDMILEEIYQLETDDRAEGVKLIYAHRDLVVDQEEVNKRLRQSGKTQLKVELVSLNELLDRKAASLFTPDSAIVDVKPAGDEWEVTITNYFSPYLKAKIDEFNAKKGKRNGGELLEENGNGEENGEANGKAAEPAKPTVTFKPVTISEAGLELIEAVQFDTTLRQDSV